METHSPLLKRKPRPPTEAEELAWRSLRKGRRGTEAPDPCPYVRLTERKGVEIGIRGTF